MNIKENDNSDEAMSPVERDPLDMAHYHLNRLPKKVKSGFEKWMVRIGGPLAAIS
ncbi:MAG: hypothetical protein GY950_05740, partial [bacterium]|nr:hypothetical protein [bacterium]